MRSRFPATLERTAERPFAAALWLGGMNLITIKLCLNSISGLATVWQSANRAATQNHGATNTAGATCSHLNLAMDAACHTDELPEQRASTLDATANLKLQPLWHLTVDARQQLREISSKLLVALGGWTLDEHAVMRALPPNRYSAKVGFGLAWLGLASEGACGLDSGWFWHF